MARTPAATAAIPPLTTPPTGDAAELALPVDAEPEDVPEDEPPLATLREEEEDEAPETAEETALDAADAAEEMMEETPVAIPLHARNVVSVCIRRT